MPARPRPKLQAWPEYVFYAGVDAPAKLLAKAAALEALSEHAMFTRLLGSHARAAR